MTNPRVTRVQNLRRSNAAGRHGLGGRRPEPSAAEIIAEHAEAVEEHLKALAAGPHNEVTYECDYGVRFVCACGETSGYYTSQATAEDAWAEHVSFGPRSPGTTVEA